MPAPGFQTGTVTFLFTDIEGSTRLLRILGRARYGEVMADQQRLLRAAFAAHHGEEIDTQGDSFFVAFRSASDAVAAAAEIQRSVAAHVWPEGAQLRVRIGIHTGEAAASSERYLGLSVHRAARIGAAGHGGQVLLSSTTKELAEEDLPPGVTIRDLGERRLKDIEQPQRLYQLEIDGLQNKFAQLRTLDVELKRKRRRMYAGAALIGVAAAAVAVPVFALAQGGSGGKTLHGVAANSVGVIDTSDNKITHDVPIGTNPTGLAVGHGAIWVTNAESQTVSQIDPQTNTLRDTIDVGHEPEGVAFGGGAVWVANALDSTVSRIDPETNRKVDTIDVGNGPSGVAFGFGSVWVANAYEGTVSRIDPRRDVVIRTLAAGAGASGIATGVDSVWVANEQAGTVSRLDPQTNDLIDTINVGNGPHAIAVGAGAVWVTNGTDGTVSRIDPATDTQTAFKVGEGPNGIAIAHGAVWIASEFDGNVFRIDPGNLSTRTITVGNRPTGIVALGTSVYVAVRAASAAHRGGTLVALHDPAAFEGKGGIASIDPAFWSRPPLQTMIYDALVGFWRVGGRQGNQLVADLATTIPSPSGDGRTYRFQLRPNIRYSDGRRVRPADFRYALERIYKLKSPQLGPAFSFLIGADTCLKQPLRCDLSRGVVADSARNTITFHLAAPDPDFGNKLVQLAPVPEGTLNRILAAHPPPGTGPYAVASNTARQVTLVRNPRFHVWSQAARPDGYPDRIVVKPERGVVAALKEVEHGRADFAQATQIWNLSPDVLHEIDTRYRGQAHFNPAPQTTVFVLNTTLPPFDDLRVRRAVNYAFDRNETVRLQGGKRGGRPTCQLLPPNFPGYRPYCPFTVRPSPTGTWRRPDLAAARRLVAASRTKGMAVTVWACRHVFCGRAVADSRYLVSLLNRLGYRARLKIVPVPRLFGDLSFVRRKVQAAMFTAGPSFWLASDFITLFRCRTGLASIAGGFCNREIDARIEQALAVQIRDRARANVLWAQIERQIIDAAPIVPILNPNAFDFVSKRVGNFQFNQAVGALRDQLWVR
jgi:YVTN family beta-propeller protein